MDLGLNGRVALVTGASRGIGRAIAEALAAEGVAVAVAARSREGVREVADAIGGRDYVLDSTDLATVDPLLDAVQADMGAVDIYVANTGGPPAGADPLDFSVEQWEAAHRALVVCPMLILRRLLPDMRARGFGRVVAVSSSTAREPLANLQLSNANRPGLLAAMKLLARDAACDGVTLNAVLPGRIATERIAGVYGDLEAAQAAAREEIPAGRLGTVQELAGAAVFLCATQAGYVTGQSLLVDGGLTRSW